MKKFSLLVALAMFLTSCGSEVDLAAEKSSANIYFVADTPRGFKLYSEEHEFEKSDDLALEVISTLISGGIAPFDPDYTNLWGGANSVSAINLSDSVATIDLDTVALNVGAEAEQRAIDQIVWTYLELAPAVQSVRFTVNGSVIESFAGHVDTTGEFTRAPGYEVLNPLQISSISEGEELSSPVSISGEACTFEANVVWRLSMNGNIIKEEPTTAATACPDRSAWSVTLGELAPGDYKFEALEFSAEDGSLFAIDDKNFTVK